MKPSGKKSLVSREIGLFIVIVIKYIYNDLCYANHAVLSYHTLFPSISPPHLSLSLSLSLPPFSLSIYLALLECILLSLSGPCSLHSLFPIRSDHGAAPYP